MSRKILVVSDSHGDNTNLCKAISAFGNRGEDLELLIHLGDSQGAIEGIKRLVDCPVEAVRGNCDGASSLPIAKLITIGKETALITHGHRYGCKMGPGRMVEMAQENGAGMVLFGHTHVPMVDQISGIRVLNPGSISRPRQSGFRPTYLVLTIGEDDHIEHAIVTM